MSRFDRALAPTAAAFALALLTCGPVAAQVEVQSLDRLDLFSTGATDTGLGGDLWRGTSPSLMRTILPNLGSKPMTPAAARLAKRVLATAAVAPEGVGGDADLAGARVRALVAMGDLGHAASILDRTSNISASSVLSQAAAETALIQGDDDKACRIGDGVSTDRGAIYWVRLRAFCQMKAGDTGAAELTFTLANQQRDATYARLMGAAMGAGPPGAASLRNGLDYALSRHLKLDLAPAMATAGPALAAALTPPPPPPPPVSGDFAQAETAALAFLRKAKGLAEFNDAARDAAPTIAAQAQARAVLQDPVLFARAAVAAGDVDSARAIRAGISGEGVPGADPTSLALLDGLIAAAAGQVDAPTLDRLVERGKADAKSQAQAAALILFALADGKGGAMGPEARAEFAGFAVARGAALPSRLWALDAAAEAGLKGETALLALTVADVGPTGPAPADRARIVQALRRAGLAEDARAFAVEGLLLLQIK